MTTSDQQSALLAAILADPADDTARLVYADWLEENGQPDRAEFIRVQCRLAEMMRLYDSQSPLPEDHPAHAEWKQLRAREWELWNAPLVLREMPDASVCEINLALTESEWSTRSGPRSEGAC